MVFICIAIVLIIIIMAASAVETVETLTSFCKRFGKIVHALPAFKMKKEAW
jgi:hypothetical protein